jgi:hypothetical protein
MASVVMFASRTLITNSVSSDCSTGRRVRLLAAMPTAVSTLTHAAIWSYRLGRLARRSRMQERMDTVQLISRDATAT